MTETETRTVKIADVLGMISLEGLSGGYSHGLTVADAMSACRRRVAQPGAYCDNFGEYPTRATYAELRDLMAESGTCRPVEIGLGAAMCREYNLDPQREDEMMLGDGHHRVAIAVELGWEEIPCRVVTA